ncbi:MAG: hypothetical protein ACYDEY_12395 [Acidimicrobiales bacterium]
MSRVRAMRREAYRLRQVETQRCDRVASVEDADPEQASVSATRGSRAVRRRALRLAASGLLGVFAAGGAIGTGAGVAGATPAVVLRRVSSGVVLGKPGRFGPHFCWYACNQPSYPGASQSHYVTRYTLLGSYNGYYGFAALGCEDAVKVTNGPGQVSDGPGARVYEILDFGAQYNASGVMGALVPGQSDSSSTFASDTQIVSDALNYISGWGSCEPGQAMTLGIGTNDSAPPVTVPADGAYRYVNDYTYGEYWAQVVVDAYVAMAVYLPEDAVNVKVEGANDIENGNGWATYNQANWWAFGFGAEVDNNFVYYDYGDAICSAGRAMLQPGGCRYGWTPAEFYKIAWGNHLGRAFPEIYNNSWASTWKMIQTLTAGNGNGYLEFSGVLWGPSTAGDVTNTRAAWSDLEVEYDFFWRLLGWGPPAPTWLAASCIPSAGASTYSDPIPMCPRP